MQEYKCTVKQSDGKDLKGYLIKADDEADLVLKLKEKKLYLITYKEVDEKNNIIGGKRLKLSMKDIAMLCRQLGAMLEAGVTLVKALNILYLQMDKKNIKEAIKRLYESVQKGEQLSEALRKDDLYPELMISMIEAGEASGKMDNVVLKLAEHFEHDVKLRNKIKTAMTYPVILSILCIAVVLILVAYVLPVFMTMFTASMTLPLPTRILMAFSNFLTGYWYLMIVVLGLIVFGLRAYINTEDGKRSWHEFLLKIPNVGPTITKISAVRFTRTLSTLLSSGMTLLQSLEIVIKTVGNRIVMDGLAITKEDIRKGLPLSQSLRKADILPPMVYSMIGIGEESGTMEMMLEKTAEYYDDEVENAIQKLVSMIEPILIIIMGSVVGFIIISILLPVFEIYESMG